MHLQPRIAMQAEVALTPHNYIHGRKKFLDAGDYEGLRNFEKNWHARRLHRERGTAPTQHAPAAPVIANAQPPRFEEPTLVLLREQAKAKAEEEAAAKPAPKKEKKSDSPVGAAVRRAAERANEQRQRQERR